MTSVPDTPSPSKGSRIPCLLIVGISGCLVLCFGIVGVTGAAYFLLGPSSFSRLARAQPTGTSVPLPIPTASSTLPSQTPSEATRGPANAPSLTPTTSDPNSWGTYQGVHAPFSIDYPADWTVDSDNEPNGTVVFVSPDQMAAGSVIFLQAGPLSVEQAMDRINNQILTKNGDVNVFSSNKNADGSITEELEYTSVALGGRVHSFARLLRISDKYYLAIFDAPVDNFAQFTEMGRRFVASLTVN